MNLGDRIRRYEDAHRIYLPPRMPMIIRVDGRSFHSLTSDCARPYDDRVCEVMDCVAEALVDQVQNARLAYTQSDEVSVLCVDYSRFNAEAWFGGNLQKVVSIASSIASVTFTRYWSKFSDRPGVFDARAFVIPERDVENYFVWRQQDATKNSIHMAARTYFSHGECVGQNGAQLQDMLHSVGVNWNTYPARFKRGRVVCRRPWGMSYEDPPEFTKDPEYLKWFLRVEEE